MHVSCTQRRRILASLSIRPRPVRHPDVGPGAARRGGPDEGSEPMDQLLRVQNFTISSDGIAAGEDQSLEAPFGSGIDPGKLFAWAGATASWPIRTAPGGSRGLDDYFARDFRHGIGAEIMGRNKFGPQRGPWENHEWRGWWGEEPPFHTPVFVMTHHERPSFTLSDTTFHFVDDDPAAVLARAREAAQQGRPAWRRRDHDPGVPRRRPGRHPPRGRRTGETRIRLRLWDSPDELLDRYHLEAVPSPSGVTHHLFWRR